MKEQLKVSALLKDPKGNFAFFKQGQELFLFEALRPATTLDQRWIHWPDFYHLKFDFLSFDSWQKHTFLEPSGSLTEQGLELPSVEAFQAGWHSPKKEAYEIQWNHIQNLLEKGELQKAVPVVFENHPRTPSRENLFLMIDHLMTIPHVTAYGLVMGNEGVIGGTPESLFRVQGQSLETMAVAGTSWGSERELISKDQRLIEEHQWVIEDIRTKLAGLGSLDQRETLRVDLGTLSHLKTMIHCRLAELPKAKKDFYFLIKKLHPTSALGLSSKTLVWKEMEYWPGQEYPRERFGAPLTFCWSESEALSLVSIRQLSWNKKGARIGSGGGLVRGCDFEREWLELQKKRDYVKNILGIFSQSMRG